MPKKLTITVDPDVYDRVCSVIGRRRISRWLNDLARPHVVRPDLAAGYAAMAADQAREVESLSPEKRSDRDVLSLELPRLRPTIVDEMPALLRAATLALSE